MKKIKYLFISIILLSLTGCFKNDSMENITIVTSAYPIEYVVNTLYGEHSTVKSIYPTDSEIIDFEITDVSLEQYSDSDLFIFNGLSDEKNYVKQMRNNNTELKIIDVTSNMSYDYSIEELWLDPNNLLTIANNIKTGFNEYIKSTYLIDEINANYDTLKLNLTNLDGKYYAAVKNSSNTNIIVTDDVFKYLEKYDINVISLDSDTVTDKDIEDAKELLRNGECYYIFTKYKEQVNDTVNNILSETNSNTLELYTMTNLTDINIDKNSYINLMSENLENLKMELYK